MRVIDCECGKTLQAANDEDLVRAVKDHVDEDHPDMGLTDEQVHEMVEQQAYDADDA